MARVKLGNVAKECRQNWSGATKNVPVVGLEHLIPGDVTLSKWDDSSDNTFTKKFEKGQVLLGRRRVYLKKAVLAPFDGICSGDITVIESLPDKILPELLPFVIQNDRFFDYAEQGSAGSLSPRVKWEYLKDYEFELPSLSEQKKLSDELWAAYRLKQSYQALIVATDELVKSQFISQFGFPQDGVDRYPSPTIESLLQETISGEWGTDCTDESGTKVIRTTNFTNDGVLDLTDVVVRTIDPKKVEKKHLKKGDIILEKSGGTKDNPVGRIVFFEEDGVYLANNFTQVLRPAENINSKYLFSALFYLYQTHKSLIKGLGNQTNGIQNLKVSQYLQLQICVPERNKQDEFEMITRQADKSKFELKQAIEKIDKVMRSLL